MTELGTPIVNFHFSVPQWGIWLLCAMLIVSAIVNVWHGLEIRRCRRQLERQGMK